MMYMRLFISLLIASLSPILVLADTQTTQAQTRRPPLCCNRSDSRCRRDWRGVPLCPTGGGGSSSSIGSSGGTWIPPAERLVQIGILIAQGKAKVDDYLLLAYANAVQGNLTAAQTRYSQASELAVKNKDIEGQAIAHNNLGEVSVATGNLKEAVSQLTLARDIYKSLGDGKRVSEVEQRLVEINKLLQANPSQIQIDPARIQIDPSRIHIDPSRLQIQK